ncbi:hypothetical protein IAU60_003920 [Kwoniella sp. DSM 27419]
MQAVERSSEPEDELKDLSQEDARELRAFLDKRRWFEQRVKLLEEVPPIYPFIHYRLCYPTDHDVDTPDSEKSAIIRSGEQSSDWRLPSRQQVEIWQSERDKIEEDVLEFDGGDLARIKDMTRAATLLPLTPPSTHLVSIALDLIVLVDLLLTKLRHRYDLLELTLARLEWDRIRWEVESETRRVREEVDRMVQEQSAWTLGTQSDDENRSTEGTLKNQSSVSPEVIKGDAASPIGRLSAKSEGASSSPVGEVSRRCDLRKPARYTLWQSRLDEIRLRQEQISSRAAQSGSALDRMIDLAGPLKGLGGVYGPASDTGQNAIPDELLDEQDNLEAKVKETGGRVDCAKDYYDQCIHLQQAAENLKSEAEVALQESAISDRHSSLVVSLQAIQARLPSTAQTTYVRSTHPAFPVHDEHEEQIMQSLAAARNKASAAVEALQFRVDWYGRIAGARKTVLVQRDLTKISLAQAQDALDKVQSGLGEVKPPNWDQPKTLERDYEVWLELAPSWQAEAGEVAEAARSAGQTSALALQRYRNALRPPANLRHWTIKLPDDGVELDQESGQLADTAHRLRFAMQTLNYDVNLYRHARGAIRQAKERIKDIEALQSEISETIKECAWPALGMAEDTISRLQERSVNLVRDPLEVIVSSTETLLSSQARHLPLLLGYMRSLQEQSEQDGRLLDYSEGLLRRVHAQAVATRTALGEADAIAESIQDAEQKLKEQGEYNANFSNDFSVQSTSEQLKHLNGRVMQWQKGLTAAIPFIASGQDVSSSSFGIGQRKSPINVKDLDQAVRNAVNEKALSLAAALTRYQEDCQRAAFDDWSRQCQECARQVDSALERWSAFEARALTSGKTSGQEKDLLDQIDKAVMSMQAGIRSFQQVVRSTERSFTDRLSDVERWESALGAAEGAVGDALTEADRVKNGLEGTGKTDSIGGSMDVFGPVPVALATTSGSQEQIHRLRTAFDRLELDSVAWPTQGDIERRPSLRRIPDGVTVSRIAQAVTDIRVQLKQINIEEETARTEYALLKGDLDTAHSILLPRLQLLAAFSAARTDCETRLSETLVAIDRSSSTPNIDAEGKRAMEPVLAASTDLQDDSRIAEEVIRLTRAWEELRSMGVQASKAAFAPMSNGRSPSTTSGTSAISRLPRLSGSLPRATSRTVLSPRGSIAPSSPTSSPVGRQRTVSDTPTRLLSNSSRTMRARTDSLSSAAGSPVPGHSKQSSIPRLSRLSLGGDTASPRAMSGNGTGNGGVKGHNNGSPRKRRAAYVADPANQLDVAVAKIVNKLEVDVPVRPVGTPGDDEWVDQSGQYWIGAEGRAKLCFCRILRSRTVMVRVGGGWVELSRFLLDHSAETVNQPEYNLDLSPVKPASGSATAPNTPPKMPRSSSTQSLDTSPVAFQFLRKASESPSVREREKERFHGRRSILGRE